MKILQSILFVAMGAIASVANAEKSESTYINPVWHLPVADPAVVRADDGFFYVYATQGIGPDSVMCNIQILRSADLVHWTHIGDALPEKPQWASSTRNFWAPHVSRHDDRYYMYYSAEPDPEVKTGTGLGLCLAVAVADNPNGPFVDMGKPLLSGDGFDNIDPMVFSDPLSGKNYLYWGSGFKPLKVKELATDMMSFADDTPAIELIKAFGPGYGFLVEGSWMIYRDGYYYLFYSGDNCCGERAHYAVMVARSESPTGPFELYDDGRGDGCPILKEGRRWMACGHNSIVTDDDGCDWILYHAIDRNDRTLRLEGKEEDKRVLMIDPLEFVGGWPRIVGEYPSESERRAPTIKPSE